MDNSYKNIIKATSLFGGVQGLNLLLNLVRTKIAAELLGPEGIGITSIFNETRELVHSSTNCGLDTSGIRGISQTYEDYSHASEENKAFYHAKFVDQVVLLRSWVLLLAVLGVFVCVLLAQPLSYFTFEDFEHTWGYVLLSPAVGLATMTCGELAVLKAMRQLKAVALISGIDVALAIIISLPLYYFYGTDGIIPALVLMGIVQMLVVMRFSYKNYPPHFALSKQILSNGIPMIVLGISFALSGVIGHCAQLGIRTFINHVDGEASVGLYHAAYTIAMTYGGLVFASLDSDYFPRLAGAFKNIDDRKKTIWRQVRVTFLLVIPMVIILVALLPWLMPLLFSHRFDSVIFTAQIACVGLIFRAVYLPMAYIPLAAGDSKTFLAIESVSYLILAGGVIAGYSLFGMEGAGCGLILSNAADLLITYLVAKFKYQI